MAQDWLVPKNWKAGEALLPAKLNSYIGGQNDFLRYRNRVICTDTSNYNVTSGTLTALADNVYLTPFEVKQGEDLLVSFDLSATINAISNFVWFDLFIDDSYYLSSGTATALTRGIGVLYPNEAAIAQKIIGRRLISGLSTGAHTFSLHAARSAGTQTMTGTVILEGY
jgi:hypothetical protein